MRTTFLLSLFVFTTVFGIASAADLEDEVFQLD